MSMQSVNLLPQPRQLAAAARNRAQRWCWGAAGYAALLLMAYAACAAIVHVDADDKSPVLEKTTRQIEELNSATAALKPQLAEAHTKLAVARTVGDQPDWSLLLAIISSTIDDDVVLRSTKLEVADALVMVQPQVPPARANATEAKPDSAENQPTMLRLTLHGMGRSQAAVAQFVLRLERLGLFERVDLVNSTRQSVGTIDAHVFRIDCMLQRSVKPAGGGSR
jgi:hypothetical protein